MSRSVESMRALLRRVTARERVIAMRSRGMTNDEIARKIDDECRRRHA